MINNYDLVNPPAALPHIRTWTIAFIRRLLITRLTSEKFKEFFLPWTTPFGCHD
jgi:hypothetical protein